MTKTISVSKRNGQLEPLNINKIHKVVSYACNGISGVSASEVELRSQLQFFEGMKTSDIQETLIKAAADLISEDAPNYQYVAGRLINYALRKEVYGQYEPPSLVDHILNVTAKGFYTTEIEASYDLDEVEKMEMFIDHDRDEDLTYAAMEQFRGKYLVKSRVTGEIFETPQMVYMLIAAVLFKDYPKDTRLKYVREYYDAISQHYISLPSPIMAGVRTPDKQFSSCVLIKAGDSLDSMTACSAAIMKYVSQKAGIGLDVGRIRAKGSAVRNGSTYHTGIIPFLKVFQAAVKSCSQGGIRGGAATFYYPIWHLEVEDLLVLKNNKGTEENRIRNIDYGVQLSKLFYDRLIKNQDITLFSPNDVPDMYEAFFADQDKFQELYEKAERNPKIRKKKVKAQDLFTALMTERKDTGRIYILNVDHANTHGAFKPDVAPIYSSNLCAEIALPTKELDYNDPDAGEIALCTLSAINLAKINSPEDFKKPCELAVRALNALLDYQDYPVLAAWTSTQKYRPLGVGLINLAYWFAKNGLTYEGNQETYEMMDEFMEAYSYYLIKASVELAKEQGRCPGFGDLKYADGILPIDTYKKEVDSVVKRPYSMNWEELREEISKYGIRNATLMAQMPCETSALVSNSTNGIEPPRAYVSFKQSKDGSLKQVVPGYPRLRKKYQLLWDIKSTEGYIKICAIMQKYMDQTISANTSYNPLHFKDETIPMSVLLKDLLLVYKLGMKTLYYLNTNDGAGEILTDAPNSATIDNNDCGDVCKL